MKKIAWMLGLLCLGASAWAIPEVTLKELPPLTPLNWCEDANGVKRGQVEPCGPGTTPTDSWITPKPALRGGASGAAEGFASAPQPAAPAVVSEEQAVRDKQATKGIQKTLLKLLGLALLAGLVAKLLGQPFLRGFVVGVGLSIGLVVLNVVSL